MRMNSPPALGSFVSNSRVVPVCSPGGGSLVPHEQDRRALVSALGPGRAVWATSESARWRRMHRSAGPPHGLMVLRSDSHKFALRDLVSTRIGGRFRAQGRIKD